MFPEKFMWGTCASAWQMEGRETDDGCGVMIWDTFAEEGKVYEGHKPGQACDHMHLYPQDFALMKNLGIKYYRVSLNWARILPNGIGQVNPKGIELYRNMFQCLKDNGITLYLTMFHWEYPQALYDLGGWANPKSVEWFAEYARVLVENFGDLCENYITYNEPQCFVGLGHYRGEHAPGLTLSPKEVLQITHNVLMAHGAAVKTIRQYAKGPVNIGIAPTCGVAIPATDDPEDIEAARERYFDTPPMDNFTWNVAWYMDAILLGKYPEHIAKRFEEMGIMPNIQPGDMELISQPLDFMGQNVYNGYYIKRGADGKPEGVPYPNGLPKTAIQWPVTPECIYWSVKFLYERYHTPIILTENGESYLDLVSADGKVHDAGRIEFLERYLHQVEKAIDEGIDIRGYFVWTFLDNFEWALGYSERFGIIYVDYETKQRIVKDSALWYKKICESNGKALAYHQKTRRDMIILKPQVKENVWGGRRLVEEFGYEAPAGAAADAAIGECWAISAHPHGDCMVAEGPYKNKTLSQLYAENRELFGNLTDKEFPLLIKIIDAKGDLSIQVHPDDAYAAEHENGSLGKTECWYIMDCPADAALVIGHHAKTREELTDLIAQDRYEELIRRVPVKKGDFLQIEPGTVHAITGGMLILETQQSSDITYRVYDYGRLVDGKPRQLHVAQSIDVINVPDEADKKALSHAADLPKNQLNLLVACDFYKVWKLSLDGTLTLPQENPFLILDILEGDGIVDSRPVKKGDHILLPAGYGDVALIGQMEVILSTAVEHGRKEA